MKKINQPLSFLVLFVLISTIIGSCKKGDNDPFISFKSRDARIMANWKLTKISASYTDVVGATTTVTIVDFDGNTYTRKISVNGNPVITETKTGTFSMKIEKNGEMSWTETYLNGNTLESQSRSGKWKWLDNDKNKSAVYVDGGDHFFYAGSYKIDRLASKELVFIDTGNSNDNGDTQVWEKTITFESE